MLEFLDLDNCQKLKYLPKLPVSLHSFTAKNCIHLKTNSFQPSILENMLHRLRSSENMLHKGSRSWSNWNIPSYRMSYHMDSCFFLGAQVPNKFVFHITMASIVIPHISRYGLYGFAFCTILSGGWDITTVGEISCTIYQHTEEVDRYCKRYHLGALISDHVLLGCMGYNYDWVKIGSESGGYLYNLSFEFNYKRLRGATITLIKSCGGIPVYDLKHSFVLDGRISGVDSKVILVIREKTINFSSLLLAPKDGSNLATTLYNRIRISYL
ncbi:unnamed protein product [Lathyrus sativus]|nr:unnamed protein product [Lathyrus sativus]